MGSRWAAMVYLELHVHRHLSLACSRSITVPDSRCDGISIYLSRGPLHEEEEPSVYAMVSVCSCSVSSVGSSRGVCRWERAGGDGAKYPVRNS